MSGRWRLEAGAACAARCGLSPIGVLAVLLLPLDQTEGKFRLSFNFKLAEFEDEIGASLWAGYTQQSHWQVCNGDGSRPFRETHYEPEVMLAFHPDVRVLGYDIRLLNIPSVKQSDRRSDSLSRRRNRDSAQVDAERDRFTSLARGYAPVFSGYGESLIDYNWKQPTAGVGISLADWF